MNSNINQAQPVPLSFITDKCFFSFRWSVFMFLVYLCIQPYNVAADTQLTGVNYSVLPGNLIELSFDFSEPIAVPQHFPIDNPARIVLDFPQVQSMLKKHHKIGVGIVNAVDVVEANQRTRVVLDLIRSVPYEVFTVDQRLIISVGTQAESAVTQAVSTTPAMPQGFTSSLIPTPDSTPFDLTTSSIAPQIENIDFRRTEDGGGRVVVTLSVTNAIINMEQEGRNIKLYLRDVELPETLDRTLEVTDFATPVTTIDTRQNANLRDVVMTIKTTGAFEHLSYQTDNKYFLEIKQKVEQPTDKLDISKKEYKGQKISFNFSSINVGSVLSLLADLQSKNIVVPNTVKDTTVSLRLKNVPIDQAWDIILHANGLGYEEIGNVRTVDFQKNIDQRRQEKLENMKKLKDLEPVITEFIQINYSKADDFKELLRSKASGHDAHSFLSDRGTVSVDPRTNTLLVQDTADRLDDIRRVIKELDRPVKQVLIESRVVIASDSFAKDLGIAFGQTTNGRFGNNREWSISTSNSSTNRNASTPGNAFIVDLPANPADTTSLPAIFGLAVGKVGTYLLQLELSALQSEGKGQIVSSPRIITSNQTEATVSQGVEVAVFGIPAVNQAALPVFKKAVLELKVKPQITPDDRVLMDLRVTKDNPQPGATTGSFETRMLETQVLVANGETIVLGGVYEQTQNNSTKRIPFFADLPVIGYLFKNKQVSNAKQELLIFVTPKILQENAS